MAPPRPRGQAHGHTLAREDAGAPLRRHYQWLVSLLDASKSVVPIYRGRVMPSLRIR
jgi:hypothetical protein